MALKVENLLSFLKSSVDDWLDEKRKIEGAEGLWRIHNKLYDFTLWSRTHPGGKFWINVTRGTDITEIFESYHLSNNIEAVLHKYYRREALAPRNSFTTFNENGLYKVFKRKIAEQELEISHEHSFTIQLISDFLAAGVFLTGLLGIKSGAFWTIASGVLLALLSLSSHHLFHSKEKWRIYYFDLSLMSSRNWKIRHVLSHHQYRNTVLDLETAIWNKFSGSQGTMGKYIQSTVNFMMFFVAAHIEFLERCLNVFLSRKLGFNLEELVGFSFPTFLFIFGGVSLWEVFVLWNLIITIGSFCFCCFSSSFYNCYTKTNLKEKNQREGQDYGIFHLSLVGNHLTENNFVFSFLNSFRGKALHYLCPSIRCEKLHDLIPLLEDAIQEVGFSMKKSKAVFENFESKMPKGYTFFS